MYALLLAAALLAPGEDRLTPGEWPMFRGPNGQGVGADPLPADLIRDENLVWKVEVSGRGWGSPVVADGPEGPTVYVPTAAPDGREMSVLAYDLATGDRRWTRVLFTPEEPDFCHPTNTYASCTPVATAEAVFAHFGKYGTARLDPADGHLVWSRRDFRCDHFRGPASSPLLVQGEGLTPRLVIPFDGVDEQYVVALDAATGETLWRYDRPGLDALIPDKRKAYGTPIAVPAPLPFLPPSVLSTGAKESVFLNSLTGAPGTRVIHGGMNSGAVPQVLEPDASFGTGFSLRYLVATGDAPTEFPLIGVAAIPVDRFGHDSEIGLAIIGSLTRGATRRTTPVKANGLWWAIGDDGVLTVFDPATRPGEDSPDGAFGRATDPVTARRRVGGSYWSSPVSAGTVFAFSKEGDAVTVVADRDDGGTWNLDILKATLDEGVWATPALAGGGLILRTEHTLRFYRPGGSEGDPE